MWEENVKGHPRAHVSSPSLGTGRMLRKSPRKFWAIELELFVPGAIEYFLGVQPSPHESLEDSKARGGGGSSRQT